MSSRRKSLWNVIATVAAFLLLLTIVVTLWEPVSWWLQGEEKYDKAALREWITEARIYRSLPELVDDYLKSVEKDRQDKSQPSHPLHAEGPSLEVVNARKDIQDFLKALGNPVTKIYSDQLPLFPVIYRLEVKFDEKLDLPPIIWDSELPRHKGQYQKSAPILIDNRGVYVLIYYRLRVHASGQFKEREDSARRFRLSGLATILVSLALFWVYLARRKEQERQRQHLLSEQQVNEAERQRLEEALKRQEAERRHEEAERANLELKSQLWANIGIMAGSYAHNIKNLLVRPNDLLVRCLEGNGLNEQQGAMLGEVRHTLVTVTERLQQILQTVQRDPTEAQKEILDLNDLLKQLEKTWRDLAAEKWKVFLNVDLSETPLWVEGDRSHLQQAFENLLFNARDATFEMRNHLREKARQPSLSEEVKDSSPTATEAEKDSGQQRRKALIAAASWKGEITLRSYREGDEAFFEITDNGIGMTEEVLQKCTETHFSTKRNNAQFAGMTAGMGLGLSFVMVILDHHQAALKIESEPLAGACFRIRFPSVTKRTHQ